MDILNDYILHPENPETSISDTESIENDKYIDKLDLINTNRRRKRELSFDDYCLKYSDDIWYIWCIINDYSKSSGLLDCLDYPTFCTVCYENSVKM